VVPISRIFDNAAFGYRSITVERPLRDEAGEVVLGLKGKQKGKPQPDPKLRDTENVPLAEDVAAYFKREVVPHAPDLPAPRPRRGEFCAYVLRCSDGSFYIGQTDNFARRLEEHEAGKATWTAPRRPVEPIHWEIFPTREKAVTREKELKTGFGRDWLKRKYAKGDLAAAARQAGAWIDQDKTKVGYEIPFNRHFYVFEPPRPLDAIDTDLARVTDRIKAMIERLSA
jgi:predicted GIY-YIG superfamily endonuclease